MSMHTAAPGWYHAEGDPVGTQRYWNGATWSESPVPAHSGGLPAAPPQLGREPGSSRMPWEWWWHVVSRNYANFSGRATRAEYWWFTFVNLAIVAGILVPMLVLNAVTDAGLNGLESLLLVSVVIFAFAVFLPNLSVTVRRLHDTDRSGWWYVIAVIPVISYVGSIVLLVFMLIDGTPRTNRFGADPKGRG